ncbi:MAG TPA: lipopolysaccharide biosynthesis protein, partial [Pirellulales bacterium]|nr:lipopolysaccharide biosynthesis protein [Pirellulales bacterium]
MAWNAAAKLVAQTAAWGSTLVVARFLSPDDYGLVGMATFSLGFVDMVTEFGVGTTIALRKEVTDTEVEQLNSVSVMLGVVGMVVICATAHLLGRFFHDGRLPVVLMLLSTTFLLKSFRSVPWGLLQRDLRFKNLAIYDALQGLALAVLSVVLAAKGLGYWTLVAASITSALITSFVAVTRHPAKFRRPQFAKLRPLLKFSSHVVGQRMAWYGYSNADFLVAGKMLGSGPLGNYELAWTLSRVTDKATTLLFQVTPPIFGRVADDLAELRRYVTRIIEVLSLTVLPLMIGMALVAHDFVPVVLGNQWKAMIFPLQILSAYAAVGVVVPLLAQVLNVTGHSAYAMRHNF